MYDELQKTKRLIEQNLAYETEDGKITTLNPGLPVLIEGGKYEELASRAATIAEWIKISIDLYRESLQKPALAWVRDMVERGSSPEVIEWSRRFSLENLVTPPAFARPDLSRWDRMVELQVPGSGYGLISLVDPTIISETKRVYGLLSQAPAKKWLYLYFNGQMLNDTKYFSSKIGMTVGFKRLPSDWLYYRLVRRQFLHQIVEMEHGNQLLEEVLKGTIIMDPPVSLLFDQKLMICFPFHPKLRERYSDAVRALFPETQLVEKNGSGPAPVEFGREKITLDQITDMSLAHRRFIFKYAGTDPALRSGGHGVHKLLKLGHGKTAALFQQAIDSGEPWILQKYENEKNQVTFLREEQMQESLYHTCWRPVYSLHPEPKLVSLAGYFAESWKVHGTSEAVITGVKIV